MTSFGKYFKKNDKYMQTTNKMSFGKMRSVFFFLLIVLLSIAMLYLFRPFFYPIFWAAVIAVMFYPFYAWLNRYIKAKGFNVFLTIILVIAAVLMPLLLVGILVVDQSIDVYRSIDSDDLREALNTASTWVEGTPFGPYAETVQREWPAYASKAAKGISTAIFTSVKSITQNSVRFIVMLFIMFYSLYYFLRDGKQALLRLMHLSPLGDVYEEMLYERFTSTVRATMKSTLIVGGIQGTISGILFWIAGVEGAFIWGVIMIILAIIPAVGPALILGPAAIIMLILGQVPQGLVLLFGAIVVSLVDNFLRPMFVGKDIEMHPLIVFFATLGGIFLFGVSGFVIGPIIAALYISIMSIYEHYYRNELQNN